MENKPLTLVTPPYLPGQEIPESGTYNVEHVQHLGPTEITLIRGQKFPVCEKCGYGVVFYLRQRAKPTDEHPIVLHRIPELDDNKAA